MNRTVNLAAGALSALVTMCAVGAARANMDVGQFQNAQTWFLGTGGVIGIAEVSQTQVRIDDDGDGLVGADDPLFNLPTAIQLDDEEPPRWTIQRFLSPTQEALYTIKFGANGFNVGPHPDDVIVYFHRLDAPPTLTPLTPGGGVTMRGPIQIQPRFYDVVGAPRRTAVVVGAAVLGQQGVLWVDLINGGSNHDTNRYNEPVQAATFAPSGNAAFIDHGTNTPFRMGTLADLCVSPIAAAPAVGTIPLGDGIATAWVIAGAGGEFLAEIRLDGSPLINSRVTLDDCTKDEPAVEACCLPGEVCDDTLTSSECTMMMGVPQGAGTTCAGVTCEETEACCELSGMCSDVPPDDCTAVFGTPQGAGTTCATTSCPQPEACCFASGFCADAPAATCSAANGAPQGAGTSCATAPCPAVRLSVTKTGPASAEQGQTYNYTLEYANVGTPGVDFDATGVTVRDTLPTGVSFVSASGGGTLSAGVVTWSVGDLAVGASGQVTLTVRAGCTLGDRVNSNYRIMSTNGGSAFGAPSVTTSIVATTSGPIGMTIVSNGENGSPVRPGELITHTIELTNTIGQTQNGLRINIPAGSATRFESLIDGGSGAMQMTSPFNWTWEGSLGPSATTQIVFTARVDACLSASTTQTGLNHGSPTSVSHVCGGAPLGAATAPFLPLQHPVRVRVEVENLGPPQSIFGANQVQVCRPEASLDFVITLANQENAAQQIEVAVPLAGLTFGGFVEPNPGATYDGGTERVVFAGTLAALEEIVIRFTAQLEPTTECAMFVQLSGGVGMCANSLAASLRLLLVPEPPAGPHVVGVHAFQGLFLRDLADPAPLETLLCVGGEIYVDADKSADGTIWVTGLPTYSINPRTLEFRVLDVDWYAMMGLEQLINGVAWDEATQSAYFLGTGTIRRYRPSDGQMDVIIDDAALSPNGIVADAGGRIVVVRGSELARFDPSGALPLAVGSHEAIDASYVFPFEGKLPPRVGQDPIHLALDTDGDYLVVLGTVFFDDFGAPGSPYEYYYLYTLLEIDAQTLEKRVVSEVLSATTFASPGPPPPIPAFISPLLLYDLFNGGVEVGAGGEVYIATSSPTNALAAVQRTEPATVTVLPALPSSSDVVYCGPTAVPTCACGDLDSNGVVELADFLTFSMCFGAAAPTGGCQEPVWSCADVNANGVIDLADFNTFSTLFGLPASGQSAPDCLEAP